MLSHSEDIVERMGRLGASRLASAARAVREIDMRINASHIDANPGQDALIAIVDDDPWACEGMNNFVESLGYRGAMFMSAEQYLSSSLKQRTGCLILDVHLCGMSGPDLQTRLLAEGYRTPVIFVTALFEERVRVRVMEAGALGYLTKPCDQTVLTNCLERAVGR